jgi:hypothetical protein
VLAPFARRATFAFLFETTTLVTAARHQHELAEAGTYDGHILNLTRGLPSVSHWQQDIASYWDVHCWPGAATLEVSPYWQDDVEQNERETGPVHINAYSQGSLGGRDKRHWYIPSCRVRGKIVVATQYRFWAYLGRR